MNNELRAIKLLILFSLILLTFIVTGIISYVSNYYMYL